MVEGSDPPLRLRNLSAAQLLLVSLAALLPVVHSTSLLRPFRTPQFATVIFALGVMVAMLFNCSSGWLRRESRAVKASLGLIGVALVWMTIATFVGVDPMRSAVGDSFQSTGLVLWYATSGIYLLSLRYRRVLIGKIEGATLFAWIVLFTFVAMWLASRDVVQEFLVPVSNEGVPVPGMGSSKLLGAFAGVGLMVVSSRWFQGAKKSWLALSALLSAYLVVTQARMSVLVSVVALAAGAYSMRRRGAKAVAIAVVGVVVLGSGVAAQLWLVPGLAVRREPSEVQSKVLWTVAGRAILHEPWFGNGPANFAYAYRSVARRDEVRSIGPSNEIKDANNLFLEIGATSGLLPAASLLAACIAWGWSIGSHRQSLARSEVIWARLSAVILLATLLDGPLSLTLLPLLALFAGLGAGGPGEDGNAATSTWTAWRRLGAAVVVVSGALIGVSFIWSDRLLAAGSLRWDRNLLDQARRLDPTCQPCLYQLGLVRSWDFRKEGEGNFARAVEPFLSAVARQPRDSEAHLRLGAGLIFLGRPHEALAPLQRARALHPHSPQIALALGGAYFQDGDAAAALENALSAIRIEPSTRAWELAAEAYLKLGLTDLALSATERARLLRR